MYEHFSDDTRKVMRLANQESQRLHHEYVGTEHILLGLTKEGTGVVGKLLKNLDVDLQRIRFEILDLVQAGPEDQISIGRLPLTPRAKKVVNYATEEARNLNFRDVDNEHLLLGLLREVDGDAAQVLMNLGLTLEAVRVEVLALYEKEAPSKESPNDTNSPPSRKTAVECFTAPALPDLQVEETPIPDTADRCENAIAIHAQNDDSIPLQLAADAVRGLSIDHGDSNVEPQGNSHRFKSVAIDLPVDKKGSEHIGGPLFSLQRFDQQRAQILGEFHALRRIAESARHQSVVSRIDSTLRRMSTDSLRIAIVGEFSTGKSSLVNALVGSDLLPTAAKVCTAVPTRLRTAKSGEAPGAMAIYADGETLSLSPNEIEQVLSFGPSGHEQHRGREVVEVVIGLDDSLGLQRNLEIVDTPGVNDPGLVGERITLQYLPQADVIVFITRADQLLTSSEIEFLRSRIQSLDIQKSLLVVNAIDRAEDDEIADVAERMSQVLDGLFTNEQCFMVSARNALRGIKDHNLELVNQSGVPTLRAALDNCLWERGAEQRLLYWRDLIDSYKHELIRYVRNILDHKSLDETIKKSRSRRIRTALDRLPEHGAVILREAKAEIDSLRASTAEHAKRCLVQLQANFHENCRLDDSVKREQDGRSLLVSVTGSVQSHLRQNLPRVQKRIAGRVSLLFGDMERSFLGGAEEHLEVATIDLTWNALVETSAVQRGVEQRQSIFPLLAGTGLSAGVGVALGAMILGPLGLLGGAIGAGAYLASVNIKKRQAKQAAEINFARYANDLAENVARELSAAIETVLDEIEDQLLRDIALIIKVKQKELEEREAGLVSSDLSSGNDLSPEGCRHFLNELGGRGGR
jgi:GTPase SAR1 family protein